MATVKPTTTPFTVADALRFHQGDVSDNPEFGGYWSMYGDPPDQQEWWVQNDQITPQARAWFTTARAGGNAAAAQQAAQDNDSLFGDLGGIVNIAAMIPGPWQPFAAAASAIDSASQGKWLNAALQGFGAYRGFSAPGAGTTSAAQTAASGGSMPNPLEDFWSWVTGNSAAGSEVGPYGGMDAGAITDAFGGGTSIFDTIGNILTGGGGGGGNTGRLLSTILGGLAGSQTQVDPRTESFVPWNVGQWGPVMDQATKLMGTPLDLPEVPELPVADDRWLQGAISAAIDPTVRAWQTQVMPTIRGDFNDQYGSSKHRQTAERSAGELARQTGNTGALMSQALYPFMFGTQKEAVMWPYEQKANQALQKWQAPFTGLQTASNVMAQAAGKGGTSTVNYPQTPWWQGAAGGALTGANLYNILYGRP